MGFIGAAVLVLGCGTTLLLLSIFKWDWMSKYPVLYLDRFQRWWGSEYDSNIRKKTIIKYAALVAVGILLAVISVRNYIDVVSLDDSIEVRAGEAVPLAGGELAFQYWVLGDSITIVQKNSDTGYFSNSIIEADTHDRDEALITFTAIFTNTSQETLTVSDKDIKMLGISSDVNRGGRIKGSWKADHNMDVDGNVNLEPGQSAFLYFWVVLNPDEQTYPYVYVVHDRENYYKLDFFSLWLESAGRLTAMNTYEALQETMGNARELEFENVYYDEDLGYVILKDIMFKNISGVPSRGVSYLSKEADKGKVFMDLILEIESASQLRGGDIVIRGMNVVVEADGNVCLEGAEVAIGDQKNPTEEGQRYSSEVHYEIQVPNNAQSYQIIVSFDGETYVMDYQR